MKPSTFYLLGRALARNPSWRKEAEENLRIASSLDPTNADYFLTLGELYRREGRIRPASVEIRMA